MFQIMFQIMVKCLFCLNNANFRKEVNTREREIIELTRKV